MNGCLGGTIHDLRDERRQKTIDCSVSFSRHYPWPFELSWIIFLAPRLLPKYCRCSHWRTKEKNHKKQKCMEMSSLFSNIISNLRIIGFRNHWLKELWILHNNFQIPGSLLGPVYGKQLTQHGTITWCSVCVPFSFYAGTLCLVHFNRFGTCMTHNILLFIILILAAADAGGQAADSWIHDKIHKM